MRPAMIDARGLAGEALVAALRDSRAVTLSCVADLDDAAWAVPQQPGVNPIAWELLHLAWFAEFWVLRGPHRLGEGGRIDAALPSRLGFVDALHDSARLAQADRWRHRWPPRDAIFALLAAQLEACIAAIPSLASADDGADEALYFHRLALFHEDMHGEAFTWLRAALGEAAPHGPGLDAVPPRRSLKVDATDAAIGWSAASRGFAFDNELRQQVVALAAFEIDSAPVDNAAYAAFVEATGRAPPRRWRRAGNGWEERWFDAWRELSPHRPVIHVDAFEAEAFCRWAGRRLPSAAEWEHAAQSVAGFAWGHGVWEWTGSDFTGYTGFVPGPYRDYSQPWFGNHRELRGGSFATHARLHDRRYRNFFTPERSDVFAGFRTAAAL